MCRAMGVSRSGFNKWLNRSDSYQVERKAYYTQKVLETYAVSYTHLTLPTTPYV